MIHSFLMIGQSNMAGRGKLAEVEKIPHGGRLFMMRNGRFRPLEEPVNYDRPTSGVSLAVSFAAAYAAGLPEEDGVALIPAADGGSSLDDWRVGGELYTNAVNLGLLAERNSVIEGFLWHQGEAETPSEEKCNTYGERFLPIIDALKRDLGLGADLPVIIGGLGEYLSKRTIAPALARYPLVNKALAHVADVRADTFYVSAKGLSSNLDYLHFNSASLREFGKRYYVAFRDRRSLPDSEFENFPEIPTSFADDPAAPIRAMIEQLNRRLAAGTTDRETYDSEMAILMAQL